MKGGSYTSQENVPELTKKSKEQSGISTSQHPRKIYEKYLEF